MKTEFVRPTKKNLVVEKSSNLACELLYEQKIPDLKMIEDNVSIAT